MLMAGTAMLMFVMMLMPAAGTALMFGLMFMTAAGAALLMLMLMLMLMLLFLLMFMLMIPAAAALFVPVPVFMIVTHMPASVRINISSFHGLMKLYTMTGALSIRRDAICQKEIAPRPSQARSAICN